MSQKKKMHQSIKAVDLFCGVGGLTHGLIRGGIDVAAGYDIDGSCKYPYENNNKASFYEYDIGLLPAEEIMRHFKGGGISLLAGCAPCQPFSNYSQRGRNKNHEKQWSLASKFGDLVKIIQPDLVTMENVPQIVNHVVFQQFVSSLNGYRVWWDIVNCETLGIPQTRRRLVLLASRLGKGKLELMYEKKSPCTVRETIGKLPPLKAGKCDPNDSLHIVAALSTLNLARIKASKQGGTWRDWPEELRAKCHLKNSGATYPSVYGRMEWDKPAPTITTQCFGYGNGRFGHPEQNRAISLREAAMLQTFPATYKFSPPNESAKLVSMGRLIGNAVPVRLGEVIAESLVAHVIENQEEEHKKL